MIHKLQKNGIQGKFFKVIKSMYSSIKSCIKINESEITEMFSCNKSIRQGDGLSPVLFSLFMNDLPQYLRDNNCPSVTLGNHPLHCLMYADDLLLISPPLMSFISTLKNGNSKLIQKKQMSSYSVETDKINTQEILNMRTKY